jgi:hypothetical protein
MTSAMFGTAPDVDLVELALDVIDEATTEWKRARDTQQDGCSAGAHPDTGLPP